MCPNCQEPMLFDAPVPCALCDLTISAPYTCVMPSHRHNVCETCYSALPVHLRLRSPLRFSRLLWMVGNGQGARQWQGGPPIHRAKAQVRWVHQEHGRVVVVDMPPMRVRLVHQLRGCDTARSLACRLGRQCSLLLALGSAKPSLFVLDMLLRGLHGNAHIVRRNFCWRESPCWCPLSSFALTPTMAVAVRAHLQCRLPPAQRLSYSSVVLVLV
jgi:hypothetical protein